MKWRHKQRRGFTLLELIVSAGAAAVLATMAMVVANRFTADWTRAAGHLDARAKARVVLDQLEADLQSSVCRDDQRTWLVATILDRTDNSGLWTASPRQKPAGPISLSADSWSGSIADRRFGQAGTWLRFIATVQGPDGVSPGENPAAPAAVAYQLIRMNTGTNPAFVQGRYVLCRSDVRPAQTGLQPGSWESGFDLTPAIHGNYTESGPGNTGAGLGDPYSVVRPGHPDNVLADDIVDFGIRLFRRSSAGALDQIFPGGANLESSGHPDVVEVMLRILTGEGALLLAALESEPCRLGTRPHQYPSDAEWWWSIAIANSEIFTRRISVPPMPR